MPASAGGETGLTNEMRVDDSVQWIGPLQRLQRKRPRPLGARGPLVTMNPPHLHAGRRPELLPVIGRGDLDDRDPPSRLRECGTDPGHGGQRRLVTHKEGPVVRMVGGEADSLA